MIRFLRKLFRTPPKWEYCACDHLQYMHVGLTGRCLYPIRDDFCDCPCFRRVAVP